MAKQSEIDRLLQKEWRDEVIPNIGASPWIRVYESSPFDSQEQVGIYCGLVPNKNLQHVLDSYQWDIHIGDSAPSFMRVRGENSDDTTLSYNRFGHHDHGIEPLLIFRSFQELRPASLEIIEEIRLFHNLYYEASNSTYVKFDDTGDEVPVIKVCEDLVEISRKHLRQFLAAKQMSLVVYFEHTYYSKHTLVNLGTSNSWREIPVDNCIYEFGVNDCHDLGIDNWVSRSWVAGKRIVKGLPLEKCGKWPFDEEPEKEFEEFQIGIDENDEPIYYSCNPDKLANFFGKNPDAPQYVTPVYFKRKVLEKYYNEPSKYSIEDGYLRCGGIWGIRLDNSQPDFVIALLGDLGRDLPEKEQAHWKHDNVAPDGPISDTARRRWYLAEFADPEDSALVFQQSFQQFQEAWHDKHGWSLFVPLSQADSHHFNTLRRPLTREPSELNEIAVSLSKLLPEAINSEMLLARIKEANPDSRRSLPKKRLAILKEFLNLSKFRDKDIHINYLERVQLLRSASASHRTDNMLDAYEQVIEIFELDTKSTVQVADDIFTTLTDFLNSLREHFCPDESD